jgi:hypothetical protein
VAAGGGVGRGDRHVVLKDRTPLGNLWVTVAERFGCPEVAFGTSTGGVEL